MEEKDLKIKISVKVTDDGKDEYTPSPFYRLPWGWSCILCSILLVLDVEYGNKVLGLQARDDLGAVLVWTIFVTFCCFIMKLVDRHAKEGGGSVTGSSYPYLGF